MAVGLTNSSQKHHLQVPDDSGKPVTIPQLAASEAWHMIGIRLTLDCNNDSNFEYLQEVANQWQAAMATEKVTHSAAEFGLRQVILWKLEHP